MNDQTLESLWQRSACVTHLQAVVNLHNQTAHQIGKKKQKTKTAFPREEEEFSPSQQMTHGNAPEERLIWVLRDSLTLESAINY